MTSQKAPDYIGNYVLKPFSESNPSEAMKKKIADAAIDIQASAFNTIMLATFHVVPAGDISFNETFIAKGGKTTALLDPNLNTLFSQWKSAGKVERILLSFGGGGGAFGPGEPQAVGYYDFTAIKCLIEKYPNPADNPFFQNLAAVFEAYPAIDGIDIDLEVYEGQAVTSANDFGNPIFDNQNPTYKDFLDTCVTITQWVHSQGKQISIAPYQTFDFWALLLKACLDKNTQMIGFINLQNGNTGQINSLISALKNAGDIGVSDLDAFISSGLQIGSDLGSVTSTYQHVLAKYPDIGGGWLWNNDVILDSGSSAKAYADAILKAWG